MRKMFIALMMGVLFSNSQVLGQLQIKNSLGSVIIHATQNGIIGIGTTNPDATSKLDVNGKTKTTQFQLGDIAISGHVLKSNANGEGAWGQVNTVGIADDAITEPKLAIGNTPSSGQVLSWNGTQMVWTTAAAGDITAVIAGNGLTGGATSGDATLNVGAGTGITVNADNIALDTNYTDDRYVNESQANSISSSMIIDGTVASADVADNSLTAADLAVNVVSSVDGVTNDGGNIDLAAGNGITITPDDANNRITIQANHPGLSGQAIQILMTEHEDVPTDYWKTILTINVPAGNVLIYANMAAHVAKADTGGFAAVDMRLLQQGAQYPTAVARVCEASSGLKMNHGSGTIIYPYSASSPTTFYLQAKVNIKGDNVNIYYSWCYGRNWYRDQFGDKTYIGYFAFSF